LPTIIPRTFQIEGRAGCDGDSGGPAVSKATGAVLGVYATRQGLCESETTIHGYTNLSPFKSLSEQAFRAAGATAKAEPPRSPIGETCTEPGQCADGVCLRGSDGAARCSQVCSDNAPCPTGYACIRADATQGRVCAPGPDAGCPSCDGSTEHPEMLNEGGCGVASSAPRSGGPFAWAVLCLALLGRIASQRARDRSTASSGRVVRQRRPSSVSG
jgi:hypothetical protein